MANIDVVLDAQNEATPIFSSFDLWGAYNSSATVRLTAGAVRTTDSSTATTFALDRCMLVGGGLLQRHNGTTLEDAWETQTASYLSLTGTAHHVYSDGHNMRVGFAYRIRQTTNTTDPIRVVVFAPLTPSD